MLSKFKMISTTVNSSRTIDELDGDSCIATLLRARRAVGASPRGQTMVGWRGLGLRDQEQRTWRAPLRGYVLLDYTGCCTAVAAAAVSHRVKHKIPRLVDSSALGTSLRRKTRGSQAWLGHLGPARSAAHPARLFVAPDHNNSWSRRLLESLHAQ